MQLDRRWSGTAGLDVPAASAQVRFPAAPVLVDAVGPHGAVLAVGMAVVVVAL